MYTRLASRALKVSYSNVGEGGVAVNCEKTQFFLNTLYTWFLHLEIPLNLMGDSRLKNLYLFLLPAAVVAAQAVQASSSDCFKNK